MPDPTPDAGSAIATLRHRLDRAVATAWAVRLLGWLGRVAVIALVAALGAAVVAFVSGMAVAPMMRLMVAVVTLPGAIIAWWRWAGARPTRLAVARAVETACPAVGERLSRAVEWLDAAADPALSANLSSGLRQLAIEDAAATVVGRFPTPGLAVHGPWIVAGGIAVAVLLTAIREPRPPGRESPAEATATVVIPEIVNGGDRLARAAAVESRLAGILSERFAVAPGVVASSLPEEALSDLVALAVIHRDTLADVGIVRDRLATSAVPAARAAAAMLVPAVGASGDDVAAAIADNRLAMAAVEIAGLAEVFAESAAILGSPRSAWPTGMLPVEPRAAAEARRVEAALDQVAARLQGRPRAASDRAAVAASGRPAGDGERVPAGSTEPASPSDAESRVAATAAPSTEPRFAAGEAETSRPETARATSQQRVWSLLPAGSRPFAARGSEADGPPEYQSAVDLYYELLLESLAAERKPRRQP